MDDLCTYSRRIVPALSQLFYMSIDAPYLNCNARLRQGEITISQLGTFGLIWARKGTKWRIWEGLGSFGHYLAECN
jgi:hypothetical protein